MSTLEIFERHISPFDILFRNHFKSDSTFQPVGNFKQPHPLNIFFDDAGLHFEVACTGLTKKDVVLDIEGDILKISYTKPEKEEFHEGMIHNGLSKKSFDSNAFASRSSFITSLCFFVMFALILSTTSNESVDITICVLSDNGFLVPILYTAIRTFVKLYPP